jgi:hypothetical protein
VFEDISGGIWAFNLQEGYQNKFGGKICSKLIG